MAISGSYLARKELSCFLAFADVGGFAIRGLRILAVSDPGSPSYASRGKLAIAKAKAFTLGNADGETAVVAAWVC